MNGWYVLKYCRNRTTKCATALLYHDIINRALQNTLNTLKLKTNMNVKRHLKYCFTGSVTISSITHDGSNTLSACIDCTYAVNMSAVVTPENVTKNKEILDNTCKTFVIILYKRKGEIFAWFLTYWNKYYPLTLQRHSTEKKRGRIIFGVTYKLPFTVTMGTLLRWSQDCFFA